MIAADYHSYVDNCFHSYIELELVYGFVTQENFLKPVAKLSNRLLHAITPLIH